MRSPRALFDIFEAHASADPSRILLRAAGGAHLISAAALLDRASSLARELRTEGLRGGGIALVAGAAHMHFIVATLAAWSCDAAALAADAQIAPPERDELIAVFRPRVVITPGAGGTLRGMATAPGPDGARLPTGTAIVKLTSGSTGTPRGIAVTADQLHADGAQIIEGMGIAPGDVHVAAIPLSHSYGMGSLLMPMVLQGSPLLLLGSVLPGTLAEGLSIDEPAVFPGVPYLFDLLSRPGAPVIRRRGLRLCVSAGAPLPRRTASAFHRATGLPIRSFYGSSETGGICFDASGAGEAASVSEGCVGTPLPAARIALEGDDFRIVVSGPAVAAGYVGAPGDPEEGEFRDGSFRTGDTGRLDEQGRLILTGRLSRFVNVSGRKVNPREIELSLETLAGVRDAAVVRVADETRGETLAACLVGDDGLTRERVITHLRATLAPYKIPRRVVFVEAIPRTPRGKLDTETLRRQALEEP